MSELLLTDRQKRMLQVFSHADVQGDWQKAKVKAGYAPNTPLEDIMTGDFAAECAKVADQYLALNTVKAAIKLVDVLDDPNQIGARQTQVVAESILDRQGLTRREKLAVDMKTPDAVVIIPRKQALDEIPEMDFVEIMQKNNEDEEKI